MWNPSFIKDRLKENGRTRDWLARQCGIPKASLNMYLGGGRTPKLPVKMLMALALDLSVEEIEQGKPITQPKSNQEMMQAAG